MSILFSNNTDRFHEVSSFDGSHGNSSNNRAYLVNNHTLDRRSHSSSRRNGETYAQLIRKALMSKTSRSMTVQEIYQWFRKNTNKGSSKENTGWMGSIRWNLSMNEAFFIREKLSIGQDGHMQPLSGSRRSTEWVLRDWAADNGVGCTKRYHPRRTAVPERARASRPVPAGNYRGVNASSANSAREEAIVSCVIDRDNKIRRRGANIGNGLSVKAPTPPAPPYSMLLSSAYKHPDQSSFHHQHLEGAPQLTSYYHQAGQNVCKSLSMCHMPGPSQHQEQHSRSLDDWAYFLTRSRCPTSSGTSTSFQPTGSPSFSCEGDFPQDALTLGSLWTAVPLKNEWVLDGEADAAGYEFG